MELHNKSKVLIVDDLQANRFSLETMLEPLDITVIHAESGDSALAKVLDYDFAAILMDVEMPGLNGYQTVRLIHSNKRFKNIPIVMITASDRDNNLVNKAYESGAVDYVIKPVNKVVIINKVRQFVELDRLHRVAKQAMTEAEESKSRLQALLNSAGGAVIGIDLLGVITFANPKACEILEAEHDHLMQSNLQDYFLTEQTDETSKTTDSALSTGINKNKLLSIFQEYKDSNSSYERWKTIHGKAFYVEFTSNVTVDKNGNTIGGVVMFQNINQRKEDEQKLHYLANYDSLTDLANRAYFYDTLAKVIIRSRRTSASLAVLFIDLDHFKVVNDHYGHDTGDILLKYVSAMLRSSVREGDLVARMGGDEFAVILYDIDDAVGMASVAQKILNKVDKPIDIQGTILSVSASIGIAYFEGETMTMEDLLKSADTAMYSAKSQGRNNYQFFAASMHETVREKQSIQVMLQQAVKNEELSLVYQPQVSLSKNNIVRCEALLRWQPKEGPAIGPDKFIPIAEESGQIEALGDWVLREVCQQVAKWNALIGSKEITVAINVSVRQLTTNKFQETLAKLLEIHSILPKQIEIEITETAMSSNYDKMIEELGKIHRLGTYISLDDFGTGHASLENLRKLPLDKLKIDRSFIQDIGVDQCDEDITKVIIAIAKKLTLELVAEGVETVEQLEFLAAEGCDIIQGYYFSKPLHPDKIITYLQHNKNLFEKEFEEYYLYLEKRKSMPESVVKLLTAT
ncbi:MAG: EAL domain-containing protein [Pseudomonadales bacterium]|nr:EAL domain-containing protein [Pseudomonadales bacterium]NRA16731.1 EAL domain-containing protein [Oceanospirillaceae bacterium]